MSTQGTERLLVPAELKDNAAIPAIPAIPEVEKSDSSNVEENHTPYSDFTKREKQLIVFIATMAGFVSPLSSSIYFPALNTLANQFHTSSSLINLTITTYTIFQALSPTVIAGLSETVGRRPMYIIAYLLYICANTGLALQDSYAALLVLRGLQSAGSSGTISLAFGVVADISTSSERGTYVGFASSGFL
jgi:MFS family permease